MVDMLQQEFIRNIYNKFGNLVENKWHNIERLATLHRYFKLFAGKEATESNDELKARWCLHEFKLKPLTISLYSGSVRQP